MNVIIIGSGNVATVLGRKILAAGHRIQQVFSRDPAAAGQLATELKAAPVSEWAAVLPNADFYLVAVSDQAIAEVAKVLRVTEGLVVHTAGSVSADSLASCAATYGVLYPLQSLHKEKEILPEIPFLIDGNNIEALTIISDFAYSLSETVSMANDEGRLKLHLAGVIVNNFTNHLYRLAADFCKKERADFNLLLPLIKETAHRLETHDAASLQTGPARRHDLVTIQKHLDLLTGDRELQQVYKMLTQSIIRANQQG